MDDHYDGRMRFKNYQRELNILKRRIKIQPIEEIHRTRFGSMALLHSNPLTPAEHHENAQPNEPKKKKVKAEVFIKQALRKMKTQHYVRTFIAKLKRNTGIMREGGLISNPNISYSHSSSDSSTNGFEISNNIKAMIDLATLLAIVFIQLFASFQMFFQQFREEVAHHEWIVVLKYLFLVCVGIRIISNFVVCKVEYGIKIHKIEEISKNYAKSSNCLLDLLLLLSLLLMIIHPEAVYPGVCGYFASLINMVTLQRTQQIIDLIFIDNNTKKQYFALLKLLLANFFFSHMVGTFMLSLSFINVGTNWMDKYAIAQQTWFNQYVFSVYWAATITFTVGFGDISVANVGEAIFVIFVILIGCLILSYNISQVGRIISLLGEGDEEVSNQLSTLRRLALNTNISETLHHAMAEYIMHAAEIKRSFQIAERKELISKLPSQMREEFLEQSSTNFFKSMPFFCFLSSKTKIILTEKMRLEVAAPGEYLTHKRYGLERITIMRRGKIGLAYRKKGSKLNGTLVDTIEIDSESSPPELLNRYLLVRGRKLNYDIISLEYCTIALLEKSALKDCLRECSQDFQFYNQLLDAARLEEEEWNRTDCLNCDLKHSIFVCPKLHYMPYRSFLFLKHENQPPTHQHRTIYDFTRDKPKLAKRSALKMYRKIFKMIENVLSVTNEKRSISRLTRVKTNDQTDFNYLKLTSQFELHASKKHIVANQNLIEVDQLHNFENYFVNCNPKTIAQTPLDILKAPLVFERFNSAP